MWTWIVLLQLAVVCQSKQFYTFHTAALFIKGTQQLMSTFLIFPKYENIVTRQHRV